MIAMPDDISPAAIRMAVSLRLLPPLFLVALLCQLDRTNLAFASLQMDTDLGFSRTVHGLGSGLFYIGYLAQLPANMVCIIVGPRRFLPAILVMWGLVAMCFAWLHSEAGFLFLRLLLGLAEAGAYPAMMYQLSLFYAPRDLGLAYTLIASATAVAGLLGAPLAAELMALDGAGGLRGWQWIFIVEGVPPILLGAVLPFLLPASPLTTTFLLPAEQDWLWREVHGQKAGVELVEMGVNSGGGGPLTQAGPHDGGAGLPTPSGLCSIAGTSGHQLSSPPLLKQTHEGPAAGSVPNLHEGRQEDTIKAQGNGHEGGLPQQSFSMQVEAEANGESAKLLPASALISCQEIEAALGAHVSGGSDSEAMPEQRAPDTRQRLESTPQLTAAAVWEAMSDVRVWHLAAVMLLIDVVMDACSFWLPSLVKAALQGNLEDSDADGDMGGALPSNSTALGSMPVGSAADGRQAGTSLNVRAALLSALPFCGAAACMVANAAHARRMDERHLHTAVPLLAAAAALALLPLLVDDAGPAAALMGLTVLAGGVWATHGPFFSWPSAFLDHTTGAMGFAIMKTGGAVGGFLGPFLVGTLADVMHGYTGPMLVLAAVAVAAAVSVYAFDVSRRTLNCCWRTREGRPGRWSMLQA